MKKIMMIMLLLTGVAFGFDPSSYMNINPMQQNIPENINQKDYKDLINGLKQGNSGEYFFYLAIVYTNGIDTPDDKGQTIKPNIKEALTYFKKSIDMEYYPAAGVLGSFYLYHKSFIVIPKNVLKAKKLLQLAVDKEVYEAAPILSDLYFNYENNPKKGMELLFLGANKNIASAQLGIANIYHFGYKQGDLNIEKNEAIANRYLSLACLNKTKTKNVEEFCKKYAERIK